MQQPPAGSVVLAQAAGGIGRLNPANGGITPLGLASGYEVAFNPGGDLFVSRFGAGTVTRYTLPSTTGTPVLSGLVDAGGLAFDSAGNLFVAAQSNGKIVRVPATGAPGDYVTGLAGPRGLAFDNAGGLFVSNRAHGTIQRIGTDTTAPVVTVPAGVVVEATSAAGAIATFSVSALDNVPGLFDVTLTHASGSLFPIGATTVTASATDPAGNTGAANILVNVVDTTGPAITVPASIVAEATSASGAGVSFVISATDLVDGSVATTATPASGSVFAPGVTTVIATAKDAAGNTATGTFSVSVKDTTAPVITSVTPSTASLWPANHKMVRVALTAVATDKVSAHLTTTILSVTSNEPDNGLGDGDTAGDIEITGPMTVALRAERSASGSGRVYSIVVQAKDAAGNTSTKEAVVTVPKSQGGK